MFNILFGEFLIKNNKLTKEQFDSVLEKVKSVRVKLGLLAVSQGMMTTAQADNVNRIQAMEDKRFGDIAIDKGYLTEEQVETLIKMQGNSYLELVQVLCDEGILTLDEVSEAIDQYMNENNLSVLDMDMLKSGDVSKEILVLVNTGDVKVNQYLCITARTFIRFINSDAVIRGVKKVRETSFPFFGYQFLEGQFRSMLGFGGEEKGILCVASAFAKEKFDKVDADSYDSICEFSNCINGLYASELSINDIDVDMVPPAYKDDASISSSNMYVMQIGVGEQTIYAVVAIEQDIDIH